MRKIENCWLKFKLCLILSTKKNKKKQKRYITNSYLFVRYSYLYVNDVFLSKFSLWADQ